MDGHDVKQAASRASDHPALETAARAGYAVNGNLLNAGAIMATRMACENGNFEERALAAVTLLLELCAPVILQRALVWARETPEQQHGA